MSYIYEALQAAASRCNWSPDVQMLYVGGLFNKINTEVDPLQLADAATVFAKAMQRPVERVAEMVCGSLHSCFAAETVRKYFDEAVTAYEEATKGQAAEEPEPPAKKIKFEPVEWQVTAEVSSALKKFLVPVNHEQHLGALLSRWSNKVQGVDLFLDIINAEDGPLVEAYAVERGRHLDINTRTYREELLQPGAFILLDCGLKKFKINIL